jgi:outer membrane lipoprotein LolB
MQRFLFLILCSAVLSACATRAPLAGLESWDRRLAELQHVQAWQLDGRAAAAVGTQGWQATLNWRQSGPYAEVNLAGPFGLGALVLKQAPDGLSLNGAPPSALVLSMLQERLGFELPMENLRFWLLGVPNPGAAFELERNGQDRAQQLIQAGWTLNYDRYVPVNGDLLPSRVVLQRDEVRVRIAVDHWEGVR